MATYRTFAHVLNNALGMYTKRKDRELYNIGRRDIGRYIDVIISTDLNADKRPAMAEITHDSTGQQEKKKAPDPAPTGGRGGRPARPSQAPAR